MPTPKPKPKPRKATRRTRDMTRRSLRLDSTVVRALITAVQAIAAYISAVESTGGTWQLSRSFIAGAIGVGLSAAWNAVIKPALLRRGNDEK